MDKLVVWVLEFTYDPDGWDTTDEVAGVFLSLEKAQEAVPDPVEWEYNGYAHLGRVQNNTQEEWIIWETAVNQYHEPDYRFR